jgi:hypothetical protein
VPEQPAAKQDQNNYQKEKKNVDKSKNNIYGLLTDTD